MVIVFDLDDTLYDEATYVASGMRAVAAFLAPILGLPSYEVAAALLAEVTYERQGAFNRFLEQRGRASKELIKRCLAVYRGHSPQIALWPAAAACLKRWRHHPLYVVTDGNKLVQQRKYEALGLASFIKKCLCTYAYGRKNSKPSPHCFLRICHWEKVMPSEVVYVADDPSKDFVGLKPLGFHTIRVLTGRHRNIVVASPYEAECVIANLDGFTPGLLQV